MQPFDEPDLWVDWDSIDEDRVDEAALAIMLLGLHDGWRTWKGFDGGILNRLHDKGMVTDPRSKAKSLQFTDEGLQAAQTLFTKLFCKPKDS